MYMFQIYVKPLAQSQSQNQSFPLIFPSHLFEGVKALHSLVSALRPRPGTPKLSL